MTSKEEVLIEPGAFPLDDVTFDLVTLIHEKRKGLDILDTCLQHSKEDKRITALLQEVRRHDAEFIRRLGTHLEGRLRAIHPIAVGEPW